MLTISLRSYQIIEKKTTTGTEPTAIIRVFSKDLEKLDHQTSNIVAKTDELKAFHRVYLKKLVINPIIIGEITNNKKNTKTGAKKKVGNYGFTHPYFIDFLEISFTH